MFQATCNHDNSDGNSVILTLAPSLSEEEVIELLHTDWYTQLANLSGPHGGLAINTTEVRAGYDAQNSQHYEDVIQMLFKQFRFERPSV